MIITPINSTESAVHLSGWLDGVDAVRDVWPISATTGTIPIPEILRSVSVSSSHGGDNPDGVGAHEILLEGLDSNYDMIGENITMNGQTPVPSLYEYRAINSIEVTDAGTQTYSSGDVYAGIGTVTSGVPATPYHVMMGSYGRSENLCFTVPRNHTLEIESISVVPTTIATTSLQWQLVKSDIVDAQQLQQTIYTSMYRSTQFENIQKFDRPIVFNEKTTLIMSVQQLNSNGVVRAYVVGKLKSYSSR